MPVSKPGFFRCVAAIIYDFLLLIAVLFFATALALPFNGGKAIESQIFYPFYLLLVSFFFYSWFWTHGGQTLGLKAWKIKMLSEAHTAITWRQAFVRFVVSIFSWSIFGLGFLWILIDKKQRSWHDIASKTELVMDSLNK